MTKVPKSRQCDRCTSPFHFNMHMGVMGEVKLCMVCFVGMAITMNNDYPKLLTEIDKAVDRQNVLRR